MYIVLAILAFSILVLIHELGHFTLAKINGVKVEEFSIGMGSKLYSIKGKETEYSIRILPIGGYVKMLGEGEESSDPRSFSNKSPLRRLSIIAAGPIMNLILAIVFFSIIANVRGYLVPVVSQLVESNPAIEAGLEVGDKIVEVNNKKMLTWEDFVGSVYSSEGSEMKLTIQRKNEIKNISVTPKWNSEEKSYIIGIYPTVLENPNITQSINYGFKQTTTFIKQTFLFFRNLFRGKVSANDVGGPVTIIKLSGEAAKAGIINLMWLAAFLSVQLGIFNIIPFPALDGGWIFILLIELIFRKKIDDNKVGLINYIGFSVLMILMVLVTLKDILYPVKF